MSIFVDAKAYEYYCFVNVVPLSYGGNDVINELGTWVRVASALLMKNTILLIEGVVLA